MNENNGTASTVPVSEDARRSILLKAGLLTSDPSAYSGLSLQMDPSSGLDTSFKPVGYDTRHTTNRMVHCSICPQQQEHFDGAIVRMLDGKIGLVGNSCGKRHFFGDDGWSAITNRMRQDAEQAVFLARFGPAQERLAIIDGLLGKWGGQLVTIEGLQNRFRNQMPKLTTAVTQQVRGGFLSIYEEVQVPVINRNGDIEMRTETNRVPVCRIEPEWFFLEESLAPTVKETRHKLIQAAGFLSADATAMNVAAVKKQIRGCRDALEMVALKQSQLNSFTTEKTVSQLASWGNLSQRGKDQYEASGMVLARVRGEDVLGSVDFSLMPARLTKSWEEIRESWPSL